MSDMTMPVADNRAEFFRGLRVSVPVLLGFIPFGLLLGSQAGMKGFSPLEIALMTGLNFAGGSEFLVIQLWTWPPAIPLLVALTMLVNSRHVLMGATLAPTMRHLPRRKVLPALALMCDECWALGLDDARKRGGVLSFPFYLGLSVGLYLSWPTSAAIGAAVGPSLGDVTRYGFHMAFPAVFLVMIFGMWTGFRAARPWFVSLVIGALTYLAVPGPWYVPAGALSGLLAAYLWARSE
ncbi:AzlC family ABC transporter permease [Devosia sp. BK]|uniref:AzlC family ABC transporter permease n=1 Tax=Devosia sp. BK TaxID=2871706 RepID=UPI00293AC5AE|nr:AzlC family ABC transporter permease [Devosia sp. BK]MDV3252949.1 AzlC family ABC transporter permease [Devosia sp. BK]